MSLDAFFASVHFAGKGLDKHKIVLTEQIGDIETLHVLEKEDLADIAKLAKMTVGERRKFLNAVEAFVSSEEESTKSSSSTTDCPIDAKVIEGAKGAVRSFSVKHTHGGVKGLKFLAKLLRLLGARPRQRIKITPEKYDEFVSPFDPNFSKLINVAGVQSHRISLAKNESNATTDSARSFVLYLALVDVTLDDREKARAPPSTALTQLAAVAEIVNEELGKLITVASVYEQQTRSSESDAKMREAMQSAKEKHAARVEALEKRIEAHKIGAAKSAERVRRPQLVPPRSEASVKQARPALVDPDEVGPRSDDASKALQCIGGGR